MNTRLAGTVFAALGLALVGLAAMAQSPVLGVETLPPVVVSTVPRAGDTEVDPGLSEIRVTFSKDMTDNQWSWVMLSNLYFPKIFGQVRYLEDRRTCVATVHLEPDHTYAIWLNSEKFTSFRDADNNPSVPYLLVFRTRK